MRYLRVGVFVAIAVAATAMVFSRNAPALAGWRLSYPQLLEPRAATGPRIPEPVQVEMRVSDPAQRSQARVRPGVDGHHGSMVGRITRS